MTDSLKVYDILKEAHIPDGQARAITQAIRESDTAVVLDIRTVLTERFDLVDQRFDLMDQKFGLLERRMDERFATKSDLRAGLAELRTELKTDMGGLRTEMAHSKTELMRWMFVFWASQVAATVGIIFTAFRLSR